MYLLFFYVTENYLESVKAAIFKAGAGVYGKYDQCAWQTQGEGQYQPLSGSTPFSGEINQLSQMPEYKVEIFCDAEHLDAAVAALKSAHPCETPAYGVVKLIDS